MDVYIYIPTPMSPMTYIYIFTPMAYILNVYLHTHSWICKGKYTHTRIFTLMVKLTTTHIIYCFNDPYYHTRQNSFIKLFWFVETQKEWNLFLNHFLSFFNDFFVLNELIFLQSEKKSFIYVLLFNTNIFDEILWETFWLKFKIGFLSTKTVS